MQGMYEWDSFSPKQIYLLEITSNYVFVVHISFGNYYMELLKISSTKGWLLGMFRVLCQDTFSTVTVKIILRSNLNLVFTCNLQLSELCGKQMWESVFPDLKSLRESLSNFICFAPRFVIFPKYCICHMVEILRKTL